MQEYFHFHRLAWGRYYSPCLHFLAVPKQRLKLGDVAVVVKHVVVVAVAAVRIPVHTSRPPSVAGRRVMAEWVLGSKLGDCCGSDTPFLRRQRVGVYWDTDGSVVAVAAVAVVADDVEYGDVHVGDEQRLAGWKRMRSWLTHSSTGHSHPEHP